MKFCSVTLASASPRRAALIRNIPWLRATVFACPLPEPPPSGDPESYAVLCARQKAEWVQARTGGIAIGADTVVTKDGEVFGKPKDAADAKRMLHALCGKSHVVITGYCVTNGDREVTGAVQTKVTFKQTDDETIDAYVASGAPLDKAGAYGLQDAPVRSLVAAVEGDEDNVIGLPVHSIEQAVKEILAWQ